jgi:hypothetical protein
MTIATMSLITGLLTFAAAIVLFVRRRSIATGLFLLGTIITPILPLTGMFFSRSTFGYAVLIASIGPVCAGVGLLWYALALPKTSTTGTEASVASTAN